MLKNVFLTMFMDKKTMKEVNSYRNSFFIASIIMVFLFEFILLFSWLQVTDKVSMSTTRFLVIMLARAVVLILFDFLFGYTLYQKFLRKEHVKILNLIFKMIVSMNFIRLIIDIIFMFLDIGIYLDLLVIVYKYFFAVNYMKANSGLELSGETLKKDILVSFIITFGLFIFTFFICFYIIGNTIKILNP